MSTRRTPHVVVPQTREGPVSRKTDTSRIPRRRTVVNIESLSSHRDQFGLAFWELFVPNKNNIRNMHIKDIATRVLQARPFIDLPLSQAVAFTKQIISSRTEFSLPERLFSKITWKVSVTPIFEDTADEFLENGSADPGDDVQTTACADFSSFRQLMDHIKHCTNAPVVSTSTNVDCLGIPIVIVGSLFPPESYYEFKRSLFNDIMFVKEKRKENRGAISSTKRIYAVYGNDGTGIEYNNFHRDSCNRVPACLSLLFHRLANLGHALDDTSCVMISCYPPSEPKDVEIAIGQKRNTFTAMSFHSDDDKYLGPTPLIEVLTISGFLDPADLRSTDCPVGWQFVVRNALKDTKYIQLSDNMLLVQPPGMQARAKHGVVGVMSQFIRWVITVRRVDKAEYNTRKNKTTSNNLTQMSLQDWCNPQNRSIWLRSLRPLTDKKAIAYRMTSSNVAIAFPRDETIGVAATLLFCPQIMYCATCNRLLKQQAHDCLASNSMIFGRRQQLQVGESYSLLQLSEVEFTGSSVLDAAFHGSVAFGCNAMVVNRNFSGNQLTNWQDGKIYVAAATPPRAKLSFRDDIVLRSCINKLPIEVVMKEDTSTFVYIGTWYAISSTVVAHTGDSNGQIQFTHCLISRNSYLQTHHCLDPVRAFANPVASFCIIYSSIEFNGNLCSDVMLDEQGLIQLRKIVGVLDSDQGIQFLLENGSILCEILHLTVAESFNRERIIWLLNNLDD
eukprot:TRINITY_DN9676_c0_g1_i1.p1 TRINITY_DN9676_c0_g1~~TRINITY_DN9676_c0_g1_i1.p1  ORF type:complete len:729 (+),score=2.10 TRINITY_DN9676_c0_g1_i1:1-2187(+)